MGTIFYATRIEFDHGAMAGLGDACRGLGLKRPLLVSDPGVRAAGLLDRVVAALGGLDHAIYAEVPPNPTEAAMLAALDIYRAEGCDGVVALGGGSAIDAAKAVALLVGNPGPIARYHAFGSPAPIDAPLPPVICIPTTAGTGSEMSQGIGITVTATGAKMVGRHPKLFPTLAICDPELTLSLPPKLTAGTAIDALTHCLEAYLANTVNPPIEAVALDGIRRISGFIRRAVRDGSDREARWQLMAGSIAGGMSMPKGLGLAHALGIPLDRFDLHHGTVVGVLMPAVLRFYGNALGAKAGPLAAALGLPSDADIPAALERLNAEIGLPTGLAAMGVPADFLPEAAGEAGHTLYHRIAPRQGSKADYVALLEDAMG